LFELFEGVILKSVLLSYELWIVLYGTGDFRTEHYSNLNSKGHNLNNE